MEDNEVFTINILLNGVKITLNVPRNEEVLYREAEKLFNNYLKKYQQQHHQRKMEEILTYVAFQMAVIINKQNMEKDVSPLAQKIQYLNKELEDVLT